MLSSTESNFQRTEAMKRSLFLAVTTYLFAFPGWSAESVDEAVSQIAEHFVSVQTDTEQTARLAVTPFIQSGKNTQFSDLLLIALTGKMVEMGEGRFQVIEKAQYERALREMTVNEGIDLFDPESTQRLGKFLSVETIVVGEITPLTDRVRVDARLVKVETIELLKQASVWIPLTPTVQRQLDVVTRRPTLSLGDDAEDSRNGIWRGTGQCGEVTFGVALSLLVVEDQLSAMQSYYPIGQGELSSGVLILEGTIDNTSGEFSLAPDGWLHQPRGHTAFAFRGVLDGDKGSIKARYQTEGCGEITLNRL